ncbi:MAG: hypothetical protein CMJ90_04495 [Planctomycetes bacterium]|nr:hypothetical protein [Planctomycetota bacterium]
MQTRFSSVPSRACAVLLALSACLVAQGDAQVSHDAKGHWLVSALVGPSQIVARETVHPVTDATWRAIPGSNGFTLTWTEAELTGPQQWYAISLTGRSYDMVTPTSYDVKLRYANFDPLFNVPTPPAHLNANTGGNLWIVQYWTQGLTEYRDDLATQGAFVHNHLWNHANIVEMSGNVAAQVSVLPYVRAITPFHPAYKLDEQLVSEQVAGFAERDVKRVNIVSLRRGLVGQRPIADRIRELGGQVHKLDENTYQMRVTLSLAQVAAIARMDEVQFIEVEAPGRLTSDMDIGRQFHGSTYVDTVAGFDGAGVRAEVSDTGIDTSHSEFAARPVITHGGLINSSHGTSVYGQLFASGVNAQARGAAYMAQGIGNSAGSWSGGSEYNHTSELSNPALVYKAVLQTFSGFSPLTTQYTSDSQTTDLILFDNPRMTMTQSQSNQGSQNTRARAWAKNCVAIGGISHFNTLSITDDSWSSASIGPAADGRVKPELASFYDNIFTTAQGGGYTSSFGGTSGATPMTAGHFCIFYDMWDAGTFNNPTAGTAFNSRPQNTTARAFAVASATQWNYVTGSASNSDCDRDKQGWGAINLQTMYNYRNKMYWVDETDVLSNLQTSSIGLTVGVGEPFFKATLCWRDTPGTVSASQHLINDMDLKVTSPTGTTYWGNRGLTNNASGPSGEALWNSPAGTKENVNSLENVFVQNPTPGVWTVEIIAANINTDNHIETPQVDADYALCVLGVDPAPLGVFTLNMSTTGIGDGSLELINIPSGTVQGYCLFSDDASGPLGGGNVFGLYATPLTLYSLQVPASPGSAFHWTWPVSGAFPDTSLNYPAGSLPTSLFPLDGMAIAIDSAFNISSTSVKRAQ